MAPRLPVLSAREVVRLLVAHDFHLVGQSGSHMRFKRRDAGGTRLVVVPRHPEMAPGTLASILRRAGLTKEDIQRLRR